MLKSNKAHLQHVSPSQFCFPARQTGNSPGPADWPVSGTRPSSCPTTWSSGHYSRQRPTHSSPRRGKTPHPDSESAPGRQCPKSTREKKQKIRQHSITKKIRMRERNSKHTPLEHVLRIKWHNWTMTNLHRHQSIVHGNLLREEIRSDCRLVLIAKLFVHILIHQGCFSDSKTWKTRVSEQAKQKKMAKTRQRHQQNSPAVSQNNDLEEHLLPGSHDGQCVISESNLQKREGKKWRKKRTRWKTRNEWEH